MWGIPRSCGSMAHVRVHMHASYRDLEPRHGEPTQTIRDFWGAIRGRSVTIGGPVELDWGAKAPLRRLDPRSNI